MNPPDSNHQLILPPPIRSRASRVFDRLRRHFFAGVLVLVPSVVTIYAVLIIMNTAEGFFGGMIDEFIRVFFVFPEWDDYAQTPYVKLAKSIVSFLLAISVIIFAGWLSTFFLIRRLIHIGEGWVSRVPLVKFFYNTPKEVLNTFAASQKESFKRVVIIEYPRRGIWSLGFATNELVKQPDNTELVAVFLPTTPNPTSGFLLFLPRADVYDTNIPMEDGVRLIISGGILAPPAIFSQRFAGLSNNPSMPPLGPLEPDSGHPIPPPNPLASPSAGAQDPNKESTS